ncbi:hypothetical protein ACNAN0_04390 [Agrilactobacillus fermenti]|uniref:hypothetical protein n=1 Tax=Agrilactobacillus fermenti TaxID=2586909 RepID=UPI001E31E8D5|nr:hypothetical protein [Agrilactobacillus fermenti]MCD2256279.1 hypothetical protein [Agrilactobacillus fermenti]
MNRFKKIDLLEENRIFLTKEIFLYVQASGLLRLYRRIDHESHLLTSLNYRAHAEGFAQFIFNAAPSLTFEEVHTLAQHLNRYYFRA